MADQNIQEKNTKNVLYRGTTQDAEGIYYINAEQYLNGI